MRVHRVGITGAAGMLGGALIDVLHGRHDVFATGRQPGYAPPGVTWELFDLLDERRVAHWVESSRLEVVVHAAALVNVDVCERDPIMAERLHVGSTGVLASAVAARGGRMIYVSTDALFDGKQDQPYVESDPPRPLNVYARTKLAGESAALQAPGTAVLRTNIFGWSRHQRPSFAEWVLKGLVERAPLRMFTDVDYTPIHVTHLAQVVAEVIDRGITGLFHAGGSTRLSKHAFALHAADTFGLSRAAIEPISVDVAGLGADRPKNMSLSSTRLSRALGVSMPAAADGLALLKRQYDSGWRTAVLGRPSPAGYRFWETYA